MPRQKRGILGVKKDPKHQILYFGNNGEEWPSDDSEDSDYLPSDLEDDQPASSKRKKKQGKGKNKKLILKEESAKSNSLDICVDLPPLPTEIWLKIFQDVVSVTGPLPFLCRAQKVCSSWKELSEHPSLWRKVDLTYGWIKHKEETLRWLSENRLSQCQDINLSNWTLSSALSVITERCPHLQTVNLSHCKKLTPDGVTSLANNCTELRDIEFSDTSITSTSLKELILKRFSKLKRIDVSCNKKLTGFTMVLDTIMKCSKLTVLDISSLENVPTYVTFDIEEFQKSCPKLKVLRMGNNRYKGTPKTDDEVEKSAGFPDLEEFSIPDLSGRHNMHNTIVYDVFYRILHKSFKLKVLDIRGRCNESYAVLDILPAADLESLHVGLSSMCYDDPYMGLFLKWRHSLKTIDLSWVQNVELAIQELTSGPSLPLEKIQLTGSNIEYKDLRTLLKKCPKLNYVQLESCRNLVRGIKRLYKDEDITVLKEKIKSLGNI
ncbi:FBXL6 [Mytilus coruscus]|uniref:FBXL6 n=1 Tax=Mytilus coruscus TaxID=42192 RepID=A0A6J8EJ18_MYTCO|nr:FBXL6 [Mytilus coruscus]